MSAVLPFAPLSTTGLFERCTDSDRLVARFVRRGWVGDPDWTDVIAEHLAENAELACAVVVRFPPYVDPADSSAPVASEGDTGTVRTAMMLTIRGWLEVPLPGGCHGWNTMHDCAREEDHAGDHVCTCGDQWNRGEWDDLDPDDAAYFEDQRDREWPKDERCAAS